MENKSGIDKLSERLFLLSEYKYYNELNEAPDDEESEEDLGDELEAGDDLEDDELDDMDSEGDEDFGEEGDDLEDEDFGEEEGFDEFGGEEEMGEEEVEVDVTGIVDGVDQNSQEINNISMKLDSMGTQMGEYINKIMQTNTSLASQLSQMEKSMSQEFRKRAPTPNEELMMRSLSSYPYNQKLTDYWTPAEGKEYDHSIDNPNQDTLGDVQIRVNKNSEEDSTPKEYVLTDKDIEEEYSETDVRNSL